MYFERIYDEGLAEASYIIACQGTKEALVVDPVRDLDTYLDRIHELGFQGVRAGACPRRAPRPLWTRRESNRRAAARPRYPGLLWVWSSCKRGGECADARWL